MSNTKAAPQWWLLQDGAPTGPFSQMEIAGQLRSGRLGLNALASPVGSTAWKSLSEWGCFCDNPGASGRPQSGPQDINVSARKEPALPDMANFVCIYGLFVSPVLWLVSTISCVASPPLFVDSSPLFGLELLCHLAAFVVTLTAEGLIFWGALCLRQRRKLGKPLLIAGLSIDLGWFLISLILLVVLLGMAAAEPGVEHVDTSDQSAGGFGVALCGLYIAACVFELIALIWLLTKGRELVLR